MKIYYSFFVEKQIIDSFILEGWATFYRLLQQVPTIGRLVWDLRLREHISEINSPSKPETFVP